MGSGACYGEAYSFAICLLMEMQWIHSSCIHAGEYFHGPFEITDDNVPFIIIKGLGSTRAIDERAYNFCQKYSEKIMKIIAVGDNVTDCYLDQGVYYPGGNAVNVAVHCKRNGVE